MRKVNKAAFTGFILCFTAIVFGIATNGGIETVINLIHFPSFIVTVGGSVCAVMMTTDSFTDFWEGVKSFTRAFKKQDMSVYSLADTILELSELSRREGLLSLEEQAVRTDDMFLKKGLMLVVDGSHPELVKDIMQTEIMKREDANRKNIRFWQDLGSFAPAWGMVGTLLGLINMMHTMGSDTSRIGAGMSLALITTLYGSILANWICIPVAKKLEKSSEEDVLIMEVCTEGILSIQEGENPRIIKEKIKSLIELDGKDDAA